MGLNPAFFRFIKHVMNDSMKMSYIEHMLSSSSSLKNKEVIIIHCGEKKWGKWVNYHKSLWQLFIVALEHGTWLCLVLQLGNMLISDLYQSYDSSYSFISPKECHSYRCTMFWSIIQSVFPSILSCLTMFKGSFNPNRPLCSITNLHPHVSLCSFNPLSYIIFMCHFRVDDGGNITGLLRRVYSYRIQHIIQELDLETN